MSIANQIEALTQDKSDIAAAIVSKGGTLSENAGFDTFALNIASIPAGNKNEWEVVTDYVYSGNAEVQPTAFDISTGVYTAENHGLSNGNLVMPVLNNWKTDTVAEQAYKYIPQEFFKSANWKSAWGFVVPATVTVIDDNSFTVNISSYDTAKNINIDITKWHFEKVSTRFGTITFDSVNLQNYDVMIGVKMWSTRGTIKLADFTDERSVVGRINTQEFSHWGDIHSIPLTAMATFGFGNVIIERIDGKVYGTVQNITLMRSRSDTNTINNGETTSIIRSYAKCDLLHNDLTSLSQIAFGTYYVDGGSYQINGEEVYVWKKRK